MSIRDVEVLEAKILALEAHFDRLHWKFRCPKCRHAFSDSDSISGMRPTEAIIACLRELDRPVGVGYLRKRLETKGYPMHRFGPRQSYYYTLICRLVETGRILRLEEDEIMVSG